jgi:hypothetical protein
MAALRTVLPEARRVEAEGGLSSLLSRIYPS